MHVQTPLPPPRSGTQETWQTVPKDLVQDIPLTAGAGWLKSHVGFHSNEIADGFAKYTSYAMALCSQHRQPPSQLSVTFHGNPCIHKQGGVIEQKLVERHDHTGIVATISFDCAGHYSWFSSLASKWSLGVKDIQGNHPFGGLSDQKCPACDEAHLLDVISTVAVCPAMS